jgi:lipoyl(octanoyl) transferase
MHGLALNVNNDLSYFDKIIPCGIFHKGVTSIKEISGKEIEIDDIKHKILNNFASVFNINNVFTVSSERFDFAS